MDAIETILTQLFPSNLLPLFNSDDCKRSSYWCHRSSDLTTGRLDELLAGWEADGTDDMPIWVLPSARATFFFTPDRGDLELGIHTTDADFQNYLAYLRHYSFEDRTFDDGMVLS